MEMKNTITKTSSVGKFKGRFEQKEKWIRELDDKTTEITKSQGEKKKNGEKETKPKEPMKHHEVDQKGTVGVPEGKKR